LEYVNSDVEDIALKSYELGKKHSNKQWTWIITSDESVCVYLDKYKINTFSYAHNDAYSYKTAVKIAEYICDLMNGDKE
jgi:hypothetical protein